MSNTRLIADEIIAKRMTNPSLKLLSKALGLHYSTIIRAVEELNEGGANIRLADIDVWERMIAREPGWYWIRLRKSNIRGQPPGEWVPGYWVGRRHNYQGEEWEAQRIDLRSHTTSRGGSGSYLPMYEDQLEINETPIPEPSP